MVTKYVSDGNLREFIKLSKRSFMEREVKAIAVTLVKTITSLHLCYIHHGNINLRSVFIKHIKKSDGL